MTAFGIAALVPRGGWARYPLPLFTFMSVINAVFSDSVPAVALEADVCASRPDEQQLSSIIADRPAAILSFGFILLL